MVGDGSLYDCEGSGKSIRESCVRSDLADWSGAGEGRVFKYIFYGECTGQKVEKSGGRA